jgi:hypothetical protein
MGDKKRNLLKSLFVVLVIVVVFVILILTTYTTNFTLPFKFSASTEKKFPSAIIIGVKKGGTKALISMLDAHPDVKAAKGEVHFFDRDESYEKGLNWYLEKMPMTFAKEISIEKSPSYFIVPDVPERIAKFSKTVKLILIVRNPVVRIISDYTQLSVKRLNKGLPLRAFEDMVFSDGSVSTKSNMIKVSLYDVNFKRWRDFFSLNQFLIINGDNLIIDPLKEMNKVENFLQVSTYYTNQTFYFNESKGFYCWKKLSNDRSSLTNSCLGSTKGRKHSKVSNESLQILKDYYRPHMETFCSLANVHFSWCKL